MTESLVKISHSQSLAARDIIAMLTPEFIQFTPSAFSLAFADFAIQLNVWSFVDQSNWKDYKATDTVGIWIDFVDSFAV